MAAGLINQLPALFDDLCTFLPRTAADEVSMRTLHEARMHASVRWRQGFALNELYLELALLQRSIQTSIREYFAGAPSREGQTAIHGAVEEFFSDAIRGAIGQFQSQQDRRVNDALSERDRALAAQLRSGERLLMAAEAAGLGIFECDPATGAAVWENERMYAITGGSHTKRARWERRSSSQGSKPRRTWPVCATRSRPPEVRRPTFILSPACREYRRASTALWRSRDGS